MHAKNVGGADQWIRGASGMGLIALGLVKRGWWTLGLLAGAGLLYTAYTEYCPMNDALGIDTYGEERLGDKLLVDETSEESMIASDAPAWTMGRES